MSKIDYTAVESIILSVSKKSAITYNGLVEQEDMVQDLWEYIVVKGILDWDVKDIALARMCIKNKAIDLCRIAVNHKGKDILLSTKSHAADSGENNDLDTYINKYSNLQEVSYGYDSTANAIHDIIFQEKVKAVIMKKCERDRKFFIARLYLCENMEVFESEFFEIWNNLPVERRNAFRQISGKKGKVTDDMIFKYICGIKTGTNSGSARTVKSEERNVELRQICMVAF